MLDTCFGALARMLPERTIASSEGGNTGVSIGGYYPDRRPFIFVEFICSAWGGRAWADGLDGNANMFANMSLPPVEITEAEQPLEILCTEFLQDVGGPGKHRGGASIRRDYRLLEEEAVLQVRADRNVFRPWGLFGGGPGRPSLNVLNPGREDRVLPGKFTMIMKRGDVFRHDQPGPGGVGDPQDLRVCERPAVDHQAHGQPGPREAAGDAARGLAGQVGDTREARAHVEHRDRAALQGNLESPDRGRGERRRR